MASEYTEFSYNPQEGLLTARMEELNEAVVAFDAAAKVVSTWVAPDGRIVYLIEKTS